MKKTQIFWALLMTLNFIVLGFLVYKNTEKPKIAFINNQEIFRDFKGKQELETRLLTSKEEGKNILDSLGFQITQLQNKEKLSSLEKDQLGKLRLSFSKTEAEYQGKVEQLSAQYTDQIWKQINQYIEEYGELNSYDYILGAQGNGNLMYSKDGNDITSDILNYINQKYEGA